MYSLLTVDISSYIRKTPLLTSFSIFSVRQYCFLHSLFLLVCNLFHLDILEVFKVINGVMLVDLN